VVNTRENAEQRAVTRRNEPNRDNRL